MANQGFHILIGMLSCKTNSWNFQLLFLAALHFILTFCHSQNVNYQCNFDTDGVPACAFTKTAGAGFGSFNTQTGSLPVLKPTQPLSDVTSVGRCFQCQIS